MQELFLQMPIQMVKKEWALKNRFTSQGYFNVQKKVRAILQMQALFLQIAI